MGWRMRPTTRRSYVASFGIDLGREAVPDAAALLGFRHLLEEQGLTEVIFKPVNAGLR